MRTGHNEKNTTYCEFMGLCLCFFFITQQYANLVSSVNSLIKAHLYWHWADLIYMDQLHRVSSPT